MAGNTASIVIPAPVSLRLNGEKLPLSKIRRCRVAPEFAFLRPELEELFRTLSLKIAVVEDGTAEIALRQGKSETAGAWKMTVSAAGVDAEAGEETGARYAFDALTQMLFAAAISGGQSSAALDGAEIADAPRFAWRGFHLDSARHFQDVAELKRFLRILAHFRINSFHWHLTDNQGWRLPSAAAPALDGSGRWSDGQYTADELREIAAFARRLGIRIVPEVDVPGHSKLLLSRYPQFACDPADPGSEWCIGNPESLPFMKRIFAELMEIFPDSPIIHIGGDEAETDHWEKCPKCRAMLKAKGLSTMRELENDFMRQLARFLVEKGRTPMIWDTCSDQHYPPDTIIQVWLDIREPLKVAPLGNKMVYSVHNSLYFDYPANLNEPWETWMFELSERGVYMTDPYIIWPEKVKESILGTEACLWTETVPRHRVLAKLFPRIFAYAECAWSMPENKSFSDLIRRKELLEAAGFTDYLKSLR